MHLLSAFISYTFEAILFGSVLLKGTGPCGICVASFPRSDFHLQPGVKIGPLSFTVSVGGSTQKR